MGVENPDDHKPAFSELRSRFEKLAREGSETSLSVKAKPVPEVGERDLLGSPLLQQRTFTTTESDAEPLQVAAQHLRSSSSASELNGIQSRRPPPPPPSPRTLRPVSPSPLSSPLLRASPAPSFSVTSSVEGVISRAELIARPPPLPPSLPIRTGKPTSDPFSLPVNNESLLDPSETNSRTLPSTSPKSLEQLAHSIIAAPQIRPSTKSRLYTSTKPANTLPDSRADLIARTPPPPPPPHLRVDQPSIEHASSASDEGHSDTISIPPPHSPFSPESSPPSSSSSHFSSSPQQEPQALMDKPLLSARKPPPPPPSPVRPLKLPPSINGNGNATPKPKLAGVGNPVQLPPRPAPPTQRVFSHSSAVSPVTKIDKLNSLHRHSISALDPDMATEARTPPPLPSRQSTLNVEKRSMNGIDNGSPPTLAKPRLSDVSALPPPHPKRPTVQPPPTRYTPRHSNTLAFSGDSGISSPVSETSSSLAPTPTLQPPPRLPARRSPPPLHETASVPVPRPPARSVTVHETDSRNGTASAPPALERKVVGNGNIAPPPTRTIGLGDKLPPARLHGNDGSTSDSAEEDDQSGKAGKTIDLLPDASNSSRRPPFLSSPQFQHAHPHVAAHVGVIAVAGSIVAVAQNQVKIYDLSRSDAPLFSLDMRDAELDWKVKEPRVSSMEFRHSAQQSDRGRFLWLGTRDGHLWELDVYTGATCGTRPVAHAGAVTHIFRHGDMMITVDEGGKVLIFEPEHEGADMFLSRTQPRVMRIPEKQGFARMLGGYLWTSGGPGSGSAAAQMNGASGLSRGPIVRVLDIMVPGSAPKSLFPSENVGSVTSGTVLRTHPDRVYLGHEGGFISVWNLTTADGVPECVEVIKVSASDVLCLEGVNERLWAGGRKGTITAYDVGHNPWTVTNCWLAHQGLPVHTLFVDPLSIEKCAQLTVVSVGRDERARFWDGLLGVDWIASEVTMRETFFSTYRPLDVLIVSWNVDAAKPDTLSGCPENVNFLDSVLHSMDSPPDVIAFGFQELIDLESRKMAAKTVLLGGKKKTADGSISEKVSRSYKMWHDRLVQSVRMMAIQDADCSYMVVHTENLVGLFSCIFVKQSVRNSLSDAAIASIKRGIGGRYGNKGGIISRFVIDDTSICFINCHLAAGQHHVRARNSDVAAMLDEKELFTPSLSKVEPVAYVGGGDGSMVLDHEIVFLNGDLNYRIDMRRENVISSIQSGDLSTLLAHDQLLKETKHNRGFRLRDFTEPQITFAPTYKYDRRTDTYDSSAKRRVPAWCDRVLFKVREKEGGRVEVLHYRRYEVNVSDHRPVSAAFRVRVKRVDIAKRERVKRDVEVMWSSKSVEVLADVRAWYAQLKVV